MNDAKISIDGITIQQTDLDTATITLADGSSHYVLGIRQKNDVLTGTVAPILWWTPKIVIYRGPTRLRVVISGAPMDNGDRSYPLTLVQSAEVGAFAAAFPTE